VKSYIPKDYKTVIGVYDTQRAIGTLHNIFEENLSKNLHLRRVSAPLFVEASSGLNDDLNGVNFFIPLTTSKINQGVITIVKQLIGTKPTSNFGFVSGRWRKGFTVTTSGDTVVVKTVGSALYAKGLRKGDILVSIQHGIQIRSTSTVADYYNAMEELKESVQLGDTIKYTFRRGNAQDVITTTATQYTFGYADA